MLIEEAIRELKESRLFEEMDEEQRRLMSQSLDDLLFYILMEYPLAMRLVKGVARSVDLPDVTQGSAILYPPDHEWGEEQVKELVSKLTHFFHRFYANLNRAFLVDMTDRLTRNEGELPTKEVLDMFRDFFRAQNMVDELWASIFDHDQKETDVVIGIDIEEK